ncbi:hypothetical protein SLEP1_g48032 [Rubroshorea leprosula]|uniref:Endonuclease/exonuclease/phosphatase domain-containing protein n=1 Tax=Rubroshorea leprosula TaxID=152421 RepID=A0AAV5LT77_9ROSI|nr:hypothetical protein SLEP1_g48032 [Rubroshorea leprosula]
MVLWKKYKWNHPISSADQFTIVIKVVALMFLLIVLFFLVHRSQPRTAQPEEKDGGTAQPSWMLRGFNEAVETYGLTEVHMVGGSFTWRRRRILEKLDRRLASASWKGLFSRAKIQLLPPLSSDHNPLWLVLDGRKERMNSNRKRFRFEEMWLRDTGCYEVVRTGWQSIEREGSWSCLLQKVRECSKGLELWNSKQFGHVQQRLKQCSKRLQDLQNQVADYSLKGEFRRRLLVCTNFKRHC